MRSQVEQCALLDRLAYSDGIDEPVRKVGLTGAAVTGIRAADKHAHRIEQKSKEKSQQCKYYGTTNHFFNHPPSTTRLSGRWGPENRENQREIGKLGLACAKQEHLNSLSVAKLNRQYLRFARLAAKDVSAGKIEMLIRLGVTLEQAEILGNLTNRALNRLAFGWNGTIVRFAGSAFQRGVALHGRAGRHHAAAFVAIRLPKPIGPRS